MENFFNFSTTNPESFEKALTPIAGDLKVRPVNTATFNSSVSVKQLRRLAVFTVHADSIGVDIEPPHSYVGLHLPLTKPFIITENNREVYFLHDIHLLRPDQTLSLEASAGCRVLGANMYSKSLQDYVLKLQASDKPSDPDTGNRIAITSPAGLLLARRLANLWSELRRVKSGPGSHIGIMETEDALIAHFVMANETRGTNSRRTKGGENLRAIECAEQYINAHLTQPVLRADLAAAANVSIRTLTRGFTERHGTGPMGFLKARRLDAAYRQLLGAELDSTTVTEVATRYGFNHLGKFAINYKQAFGESPSVTLNR